MAKNHKPDVMERMRATVRKSYRKKMQEDKDWNARKQREFRKKHPLTFNKCMARYYLRKIPKAERLKVLKEAEEKI
jgi:hypothetical protein